MCAETYYLFKCREPKCCKETTVIKNEIIKLECHGDCGQMMVEVAECKFTAASRTGARECRPAGKHHTL